MAHRMRHPPQPQHHWRSALSTATCSWAHAAHSAGAARGQPNTSGTAPCSPMSGRPAPQRLPTWLKHRRAAPGRPGGQGPRSGTRRSLSTGRRPSQRRPCGRHMWGWQDHMTRGRSCRGSQRVWQAHATARDGLVKARAGPRGTMAWALRGLGLHRKAERHGVRFTKWAQAGMRWKGRALPQGGFKRGCAAVTGG